MRRAVEDARAADMVVSWLPPADEEDRIVEEASRRLHRVM
jgi:hypothetical protein